MMYVEVQFGGKLLTFLVCPFCHSYTHITGKKKNLKVRKCWNCDHVFVEEA
jgi:hypothetical protein